MNLRKKHNLIWGIQGLGIFTVLIALNTKQKYITIALFIFSVFSIVTGNILTLLILKCPYCNYNVCKRKYDKLVFYTSFLPKKCPNCKREI
jgi:hypothetical protein